MLVLSLFPGLGLLDMAFEHEGFCVVRGPDVLWGGDIRRFNPPAGRFDGVIGGPPCQSFSVLANLVRAKGLEPRFGNLIPEYERVVGSASPQWFLMENVSRAPIPGVPGYGTHAFVLDNCMLDAGDGLGEQQERRRRFTFGTRGTEAPDLRRWIKLAALLLPRVSGTVTSSDGAGKVAVREQAVCSSARAVPVAIGGSGKPKRTRTVAVCGGAHSGQAGRPNGGQLVVYRWERMLELQGLPPDFLKDAPFTVDGKRKAVGNGVPLPMGRTIARAIKAALAERAA